MMKNGALARFISIVLSVLALVTILAGVFGLRKNSNDASENKRTLGLLIERTATYEEYSNKLDGKDSYAQIKDKLDKKQAEHDKAAAQHKTDLATFSATKGGIVEGKEQLQEAYSALINAEKQLNQMDSMLGQVEAGMNAGIAEAEAGVNANRENIENMAISAASEKLQEARDAGKLSGYQNAYNAAIQAAKDSIISDGLTEEQYNTAVQEAINAVSSDQSSYSEAINSAGEAAYNAAVSAVKENAYNAALAKAKAAVEEAVNAKLAENLPPQYAGMSLIQLKDALTKARNEINLGFQSVSLGNWEIDKMQAELPDTEEQLDSEIEPLEKEAKELEEAWKEADEIKEDEKVLSTNKALLVSNDRIKASVDNGEDIVEAAKSEISRREVSDEKDYNYRLWANILAIVGGVFAFVAIPAAFEKTKSRVMLIFPVVCFTLCTTAADVLSVLLGRGQMYSCLIAAIFGLIQLIVIIPKKKNPV